MSPVWCAGAGLEQTPAVCASLFLEVTGLVLTYSLFYKRDKNITN